MLGPLITSAEIAMPETVEAPTRRGGFQPGQSGNPGGRRKATASITDELRHQLQTGEARKIAKNMIRLATSAKQEAVQAKVSEAIKDAIDGRPMQAIAMLQVMDDNTAKRLIQVAQALTLVSNGDSSQQVQTIASAPTLQLPENVTK